MDVAFLQTPPAAVSFVQCFSFEMIFMCQFMKEQLDYYKLKYVAKLNLVASLRQGSRIGLCLPPPRLGMFESSWGARYIYFTGMRHNCVNTAGQSSRWKA